MNVTNKDILRELYRVLGLAAAREILCSISDGNNQYNDFLPFGSYATINGRIRQLISLKMIEHHLVRDEKRREYYTLTEKGVKVLEIIKELEKVYLD